MICTPRIWADARRRLEEEIPAFAFDSWIAPLAVKLAPDRIILGCPTSFHRDHVRIVYNDTLERVLREALLVDANGSADGSAEGAAPDRLSSDAPGESRSVVARVEILLMSQFADAPGTAIEVRLQQSEESAVQGFAATRGERMRKVEPRRVEVAQNAQANGAGTSPVSPDSESRDSISNAPGGSSSRAIGISDPNVRGLRDERDGGPLRAVPNKSQDRPRAEQKAAQASATTPARRSPPSGPASEAAFQRELPFSFDNFIVGPCNALAREAALALAKRLQSSLNLLYLAGEAGMGKTHLARATAEAARPGQRLAHADPNGNRRQGMRPSRGQGVVYASAEEFTTEFVSAMRNGRADSFRQRFRGATNLLVVEDIQFFSGKVKTQLELFHTVQHVLDAGGRVLLTGDRSPRELSGLDDRVRTQVARGFIAELEPPDALVRRHILRSKASAGGVRLPEDCLNLLVEASHGSVRDIESMLIQVVTTASLLGRPIDRTLTRDAIDLKTSINTALTTKTVAVTEIVRIVAAFFGKKPEILAARSRRKDVLLPRQLAMYLAHRYTDASLAEIGRALGRGHPSVRNAIERIDRQILEHAPIRYQLEALSDRIDRTLETRDTRESRTDDSPERKSERPR